MSKQKANKNQPPPPVEEEEEYEEGQEEVEGESQEEDYDPNQVFEEEKKDLLDITKIPPKLAAVYLNNNKKLLFLKALSLDPYQDVRKLSITKCKMQSRAEAEQVIAVMLGMINETSKDIDFPERILKYFNKLVPDNYPNKVKLEADDINELVNLVRVYEEKLQNAAKITDPDKIFGTGKEMNTETIKESKAKKEVTMMDSQEIPIDNGNIFTQPERTNNTEHYINKYAIPDIGLMEMALRSIPNPRPNSINSFITSFTDLYTDWMQNPLKMLEELKFFFGPTHGEHAFRLWKDYRENLLRKQGLSPAPMGSGGDYTPYGGFGGFNQYGGYPQQYQNSPELEAERMADKRMDKLMKILQFRMMDKAMENQTPMPLGGSNYEEIYDQNGKVIKRIMLGNGNGNNQQGELSMVNNLSMLFKEMMAGKNAEMVEILKKVSAPDTMLTDFTKTIMSNFVSTQNPAQQIKEMLDITNMVKSQTPQDGAQKSLDAVKLEVDSKIAMQELELKKLEMQHNWRIDENQSREQDSNVDKWLNTLQGMGESIIKPVAIKFLEGFGKGQIPGGPLAGAFAGPQAQVQNPYGNMSEQEYAMRQQQFYDQQEAARERPMQPMPPNRQFNDSQAGFTPTPQPRPQQPTTKPPISAASEREIQEELSQLSPQQVQELEDKMLIDDMNREKVKNAIRAHKNGRRTSRPPTNRSAEQVQEAQNVLFRNPPQEEISEDELDLEDDEDDYEVPIARGETKVPPTNIQPPAKKFSDFELESTTETTKRKKLSKEQEAMLATGQLSKRELEQADDYEDEDDEYSSGGVPMPAGLRNASDDKLVEENLKNTRQVPKRPSRKKETVKEVAAQEERVEAEQIVADAEQVIDEAEVIPSDDIME